MIHHTRKYDNSLHYRFDVEIIHRSSTVLVAYISPGNPLKSYRGDLDAVSHLLMFYYRNRNFNIHIHWNQDWTPRMHYVNIASKAEWDDEILTAIDLDLDLIRFFGSHDIILDDEDEFLEHQKLYHYPDELIKTCRMQTDFLRKEMLSGTGIWSNDIFDWRPGTSLPETVLSSYS